MKLNDYLARLATAIPVTLSDLTELTRALKEGGINLTLRPNSADDPNMNWKTKPGPRGGVDAKPFHAGFVLTALLLNGPRRESARSTWDAWHLIQEGSNQAGYSGETLHLGLLFGNALKSILADDTLASRVKCLRIDQNVDFAEIIFRDGEAWRFLNKDPDQHRNLKRVAELHGVILKNTAVWLKN